jgi:CRISPR-associated protein Csd1
MILQDLVSLYEREASRGRVVPFGMSMERIAWVLVLDCDGKVIDVEDRRDGKVVPRLPMPTPPKSTSGIAARFLYGNSSYVLGVLTAGQRKKVGEGKAVEAAERCAAERAAWIDYHRQHLKDNDDEGLRAVLQFCDAWRPEHVAKLRYSDELVDNTIALRLDGDIGPDGNSRMLHDRLAARAIWANLCAAEEAPKGICLVTGQSASIATLHPSIKGVWGAQSSGASLVSFNCDAVRHYGPDSQGINGPISVSTAHAYTTVLNARLAAREHRIKVGDATGIFWVETNGDPLPAEELLATLLRGSSVKPGEDVETARLRETLAGIAAGRPLEEVDPGLDPDTRYHVLALAAPVKARLTVRWYLVGTLGELVRRIGEHWRDMSIEPRAWETPPSVQWLALQSAPARPNKKGGYDREEKDINPTLPGEMLQAVLMGKRYPSGLLQTLVQRLSTDRDINRLRIAMVKGCLARDHRLGVSREGVAMALNADDPSQAYQLGRLFAVLDRIYRAANPGSERALADSHYRMASTQPAAAYPRLLATAQHHLAAIRREGKGGLAYVLGKELEAIAGHLGSEFPPVLRVTDQGRFALGFYHQRSFRKPADANETITNGE